jgi:hypothetical protein
MRVGGGCLDRVIERIQTAFPLKVGPKECEFQAAIKDMEFDDLY